MRAHNITGQEHDWLGPVDDTKHLVYKMSSAAVEMWWLNTQPTGLELEDHSEFSIRIHDPKVRSLSWIFRTICVIPKSHLRAVYALIGKYLEEHDANAKS